MFDSIPDPAACPGADAATAVAAIRDCYRAEAGMTARRLAWTAVLLGHREADPDDDRPLWNADNWTSACAEVSCAMIISPRKASTQMRLALAFHERLPQTFALLEKGAISARTASVIAWRTTLVADRLAATVDKEIAARAGWWGMLSDTRLDHAIDAILEEHDPDAAQRYRDAAKGCDVQTGKPDDATGTASLYGRLDIATAELLKRTLNAIGATVCPDDPRTTGERRNAAVAAILAKTDRLVCLCERPECDAATKTSHAANIVVHVLADEATIRAALEEAAAEAERLREERAAESEGDVEPAAHTDDDLRPAARTEDADKADEETEPAAESTDDSTGVASAAEAEPLAPNAKPKKPFRAATILGGKVIPGPLLAEMINTGNATLQPLETPCQEAESGRYPSDTLRRWLKSRDITCRFPNCTRPAEYADIDHTTPWPDGATHPSGLKCLCRTHHLLKTFWNGTDGWTDVQYPDGTITWTAPTGHTYTTKPGSWLLHPDWNTTTPPPANTGPPPASDTNPGRNLKMPKRKRTREQDRAYRIQAERELNAALRSKPPPRGFR
ncbi:HNH endonuclease signature motif containing protein [soil metagenome]